MAQLRALVLWGMKTPGGYLDPHWKSGAVEEGVGRNAFWKGYLTVSLTCP